MARAISPRLAALGVAGILGIVVVAAVGFKLVGSGSAGPSAAPGASRSPGASGSLIAGNPSLAPGATPTPSPPPIPTDAAGSPLPTPLATPSGPPRERALAPREIFGFLPYWKLGQATTQVPLDQLTTIAIFGVEAGKNGILVRQSSTGRTPQGWTAWQSTDTTDLIRRAHGANVRVVLTIQRFSWTANQATKTVALLSSPTNRATLARQIAIEVKGRGADGVNLDFEPMPSAVRDAFTSFVQELRVQLDQAKPGLQLTFDTTVNVAGWDLPALTADNAADAVLFLGYDYRIATADVASSVDPVTSTDFGGGLQDTLDTGLAEISPDRAILALPWYGRAWSTFSDQPGSATLDPQTYGNSVATEYGDAIALARTYGINYDVNESSAWTAYRKQDCATCPETWRQLWFDDVDSMQVKQKLVLTRGMRGLGIWVIGDDHSLPDPWATIRFSFGGTTDSQAPTGTAKVDPHSYSQKHGNLPVIGAPLKLTLTADDGHAGSGVAFVRISAMSDVAVDGNLVMGVTYPWDASDPTLSQDLSDPRLGPGFAKGQAAVSVQWRDIAGNWSKPMSVPFWLLNPVVTPPSLAPSLSPSPLP